MGLDQFGFRAIIAPSYADIFFNNSFKNGLLPIVLSELQVSQLFDEVPLSPAINSPSIWNDRSSSARREELSFDVQPFRKYCLLNGFDDIGLTLQQADKIKAFEAQRLAEKPWLAHTMLS